MTSSELMRLAEGFWRMAGCERSFPRDLESGVLWALPLAVVRVPRLQTQNVRNWLSQNGGAVEIVPLPDRPLRACIVASRGCGIVFLDGVDQPDEQRLSLAHETAHFILDYLLPRDRAISALGTSIIQVLDGDRPATPAERLSAVLRGAPIGVYTRLAHRGRAGRVEDADTLACEDAADQLAMELLAPRREAIQRVSRSGLDAGDEGRIVELLQSDFGLPGPSANAYAKVLRSGVTRARSMRSWLGLDSR